MDHIRNQILRKELNTFNILDKLVNGKKRRINIEYWWESHKERDH
jgi:hypothetical protein